MIDNFEQWLILKDNKKKNSAYSYKLAIPHLSEHYSKYSNRNVDFFNSDIETIRDAITLYQLNGKFSDYGNKGNGTFRNALNALLRMKEDNFKEGNYIQNLIKVTVSEPEFQALINDSDFYFQNLLNVKDKFFEYKISNSEIENIIENYEAFTDGTFEDFVLQYDESIKPFLEILAEYITYLDKNASGKNRWNKYSDKRAIALAFVRMPFWVKGLLRLKINPEMELKGSVKNAIDYSISPMENLTVLSENHRQHLSQILLKKEYNELTFQQEIFEYFKPFGLVPKNRMNYSYLISSVLYSPKIKPLWDPKENQSSDYDDARDISSSVKEESISKLYRQSSLNQILYGPPGTGKTFATKKIAVEIIENKQFSNSEEDREVILEIYERLVENEQIQFTTFHQSFSYEDFIEGIKPVLKHDDGNDGEDMEKEPSINYEIERGVFKNICQLAEGVRGNVETVENFDFRNKDFYKMSLGGKNRLEKHKWSIDNNLIFLGWGKDRDFTRFNKINNWKEYRDAFSAEFPELVAESKYVIQAVYIFQRMKVGDIVVISKGNHIIDAIGIIESDYFFDDSKDIDNYQFRKVKWLAKDMNVPANIFINKGISQQTIYQFYNDDIKFEAFEEIFKGNPEKEKSKKYVLIIDEINRGNVSSIFGELITLIESDKRTGQKEAIEAILPYSKNKFSVPDNVYIVGTMNTADRSVEALDTALRRRFSFKEIMPDPTLLEDIEFKGFNLDEVLKTINERIEFLLDRDHTIGHSYFMNLESNDTVGLEEVFKNKVIPLLQEYFYHDYEKIALILGAGFVTVKTNHQVRFPVLEGVTSPDHVTLCELVNDIEDIEAAVLKLLNRDGE